MDKGKRGAPAPTTGVNVLYENGYNGATMATVTSQPCHADITKGGKFTAPITATFRWMKSITKFEPEVLLESIQQPQSYSHHSETPCP